MELCLYNAVLTAMSSNGRQFTYVNQLASSEQDLSKREQWFKCACCPPNILRLLAQIGGYVWNFYPNEKESSAQINVHLFMANQLRFAVGGQYVEIEQKTDWPWNGDVTFNLRTDLKHVSMRLRIPFWARSWRVSSNRGVELPLTSCNRSLHHSREPKLRTVTCYCPQTGLLQIPLSPFLFR